MDLSSLERKEDSSTAKENDADRYINVDVLRDFPSDMDSGMDKSQMSACQKMLTSRVAIVQGPPGTGKTFVSVSALKVMDQNLRPEDPPILVAAQTNHALDQLLNHVLSFEPNILRLGGRSNKANEAILKRTLFNLRHDNNIPGGSSGFRQAYIQREKCKNNVMAAVEPLTTEILLTAEVLFKHDLITKSQFKSLYGNSEWGREDGSGGGLAECKYLPEILMLVHKLTHTIGLTEDQLMPVPETAPVNLGLEVEQESLSEERVEDIDNEFKVDAADEERNLDDDEGLIGDWLPFKRKFTGKHSHPPTLSDRKIKNNLTSWKNLYDVPLAHRGEVYRFFEKEMNKFVLKDLKTRLKEYQDCVNGWTITKVKLFQHLFEPSWGALTFVEHIQHSLDSPPRN
jgi:helicase required for RNAi-mediated heterochromatin assembly 1